MSGHVDVCPTCRSGANGTSGRGKCAADNAARQAVPGLERCAVDLALLEVTATSQDYSAPQSLERLPPRRFRPLYESPTIRNLSGCVQFARKRVPATRVPS